MNAMRSSTAKADRLFISNEEIVENRIYVAASSPMAGEELTAQEEADYAKRNSFTTSKDSSRSSSDGDSGSDSDSDDSSDDEDRVVVVDIAPSPAAAKPRKARDRSMRDDIVHAFLNSWYDPESDDDMDIAKDLSLAEVLERDAAMQNASQAFKDFLIGHVKSEVFNELHFERRVLQYVTFVTNVKKKTTGEVYVVNWPRVLSEIGNYIIKEFRDSNSRILANMNLFADSKAELQNAADMKAFTRVIVHRINCVTYSVGMKLVDQWMKYNSTFCDPQNLRLAKKAKKADFMERYHKVTAGNYSCHTAREEDTALQLQEAQDFAKPDVASLLFLIQPLPENDLYMNILVEVLAHQVEGRAVDWDVDNEMRALFHKKPLPVKPAAKVKIPVVAVPVVAVPVVAVANGTPQISAGSSSGSSSSSDTLPPTVGTDLSSPNPTPVSPGSSTSRGPPPSAVDENIEESIDMVLKRLLKQLLEFVLAALSDNDAHLCLDLKNVYSSEESLVLLMEILRFVREEQEQLHHVTLLNMGCCSFIRAKVLVPFPPGSGGNTLGNGYCFFIAGMQLRERAERDFSMSVEDMISYAEPLFGRPDDHPDLVSSFRSLISTVIKSIRDRDFYPDQAVHLLKAESVLKRHTEDPYSEVGPEFYGHLEWIHELPFNITVFDSTPSHAELEHWAKLTATSILPQQEAEKGNCHTLSELAILFGKPLNSCVFTRPHFFSISSPSQEVMMNSFNSLVEVLGHRVIERVMSFEWFPVLTICENLVNKTEIAAGSSNLVSNAIERLFSALRSDNRVPSSVLFEAMKPASRTVAAARNGDKLRKYIEKIAQMVLYVVCSP
jgi:hypothetical protein